jgi:hypothetical protein
MPKLTIQINAAPITPLNLRLGVIYAPRVRQTFAAYDAIEDTPGRFIIRGYNDKAIPIPIYWSGDLVATYQNFATFLRMDVEPE